MTPTDSSVSEIVSSTAPADGTTTEAPVTRPFEGFFFLRKDWEDQESDIDRVTINTTLSHVNLPADWTHTDASVMMPEWGTSPLRRTWIVRLPTHFEGKERYLFHYFFHVFYANGTERASNIFTHMIQPHPIEFLDHAGECVFVRLHWSLGPWTYPQDTELECEGIEWGSEFSVSNMPYRSTDRLFQKGRALVVRRSALPRRFRGIIWAPRGSEIRYCFQLVKHRGEGFEVNWENNFGRDFCLTV